MSPCLVRRGKHLGRTVPNSKCVSVLGQYECNSSLLLNHKLIHFTFLICQTCVHSDFKKVRLGPNVKIKFCIVVKPTISGSLDGWSTFYATMAAESLSFAPLIYAWKTKFWARKRAKYITWEIFIYNCSVLIYTWSSVRGVRRASLDILQQDLDLFEVFYFYTKVHKDQEL